MSKTPAKKTTPTKPAAKKPAAAAKKPVAKAAAKPAAKKAPAKVPSRPVPLWALVWNLQSGVHIHKSRVEQFTDRRPSINLDDFPGAWGHFFDAH